MQSTIACKTATTNLIMLFQNKVDFSFDLHRLIQSLFFFYWLENDNFIFSLYLFFFPIRNVETQKSNEDFIE